MFRKKTKISELKEGVLINDIFVVKVKREFKPYIKGHSFRLILSDSSGQSIEYIYWGGQNETHVRNLYDKVSEDDVIKISGKIGKYRNNLQISSSSNDEFVVLNEEEYDPKDFILPPKRDPEEMYDELKNAIEKVVNPEIKKILTTVFYDKVIEEKVKKHPAGIQIHHNRYGGLLEHTLEVLEYCLLSSKFFELDKDYLIAGSLLHDIGKLDEMSMKTRIKGTREGQLLGHIILGIQFVSKKMDELKTPKLIREKLLHIIASHHGKLEYGSPKPPMFPEALAVHLGDMMSSQLSAMEVFLGMVKGNTQSEFAYHKRSGKNILLN